MNYPLLSLENWPAQSAELRREFQETMYGWLPAPDALTLENESRIDSQVTLRRLRSRQDLTIEALQVRPENEPRATFVAVNFDGNHALIDDPIVSLPRNGAYAEPKERGSEKSTWCLEEIVGAGFGLVTFCHSDVVPDDPHRAEPVLESLSGRPFGAIAAWAWGLLSVATTVKGPVIFVGHSRMGKAALLAGVFGGDGVIPIQTGCGGAAPSRTNAGETVAQITKRFPHWFLPAFAEYAGQEDELPFDQHALLALCAPKPLLILNADDDLWANPSGQEAMAELARPIFESCGASESLLYRRRPGGHSVTPQDWAMILDFARSHW